MTLLQQSRYALVCLAGLATLSIVESTDAVGHPGAIASATVTRVGTGFQIAWTTSGKVTTVRVYEGTTAREVDHLRGAFSGVPTATIDGLNPNEGHYFRIQGGSGAGLIVAERGIPQIIRLDRPLPR